jgi:hypothetical protein
MAEEKTEDGVLLDAEGNELKEAPVAKEEAKPAENEDERLSSDDEGSADEEGHVEETEEEAEARRERNRQRRAENKQRRKDHVESLRRELAARDELLQQQAQRLDALERRSNGADMSAVDAELKRSVDAYNYFKQQHADAVTAANGQVASDAQEKMMQAAERARQMARIKQAVQNQAKQPPQQPLDPRIKSMAEGWLEKNSWYDPDVQDADSQIVYALDQGLTREGWNPTTPQYWKELDARIKKYLPHRVNTGYNSNRGNVTAVPVAGSSRDATAKATGYRLSAERVKAIKDAGKWEDPKERAAMMRAYQEYDKQQTA